MTCEPAQDHPTDKDRPSGTPNSRKKRRGEDGAPGFLGRSGAQSKPIEKGQHQNTSGERIGRFEPDRPFRSNRISTGENARGGPPFATPKEMQKCKKFVNRKERRRRP